MLLSYQVMSASQAKVYFSTSVSPDVVATRQDYYSEGQESPGRFGGKLAAELGLTGKPVDAETFYRLCDNRHPTQDKSLTPRTNEHRRIFYDFTVSGPKSFSIVEAFAEADERERLRRAFAESIDETLASDMEPDMQTRVRKNGADHDVTTGNVLAVQFPHATARPENGQTIPDMHWHTHLLIWNATAADDGRIKAGQFGNIIRDKPYYRAAFYARLAGKLESLGYAIDRRGDTDWEIAGVPQRVIDVFSKRTKQIEAEADKRGITDAAEKAVLGAKIRSKKQKELTLPELRQAWDAQLRDGERDALVAVYRKDIAADQPVTAREAVDFALAHLSEKLSVFPERELMRVALLHGLGHVTPEAVAAELPRHGVLVDDIDGRRMATTEALQDEERFLVSVAGRGRGAACPVGVAVGLTRTLADGRTLNDGQWAIAQGLLNSSNRVEMFEGPAGAGKSFSLKKYDEGMRLAGAEVAYLATTAKAVGVLEDDGFTVNTVARFLVDERMQARANGGRVVIDEASMLGHKDAVKLFGIAERENLKLVFVGDAMQHGSVARGSLLRVLKEYAGIKPHRLTEIMRQADHDYRAAARHLSEGRTLQGFELLEGKGWVQEIESDAERYRAMAADYVQTVESGATCLVVSPTHAEAAAITAEIRNQLRQAGRLGSDERQFSRLVAVDASEAQRGQASTYHAGEVIQFHQNAKGFTKGERLTITDPAAVPLHLADKFTLYRQEAVRLAAGDNIRFTGTVKAFRSEHAYKNGDTLTVAGFTPGGRVRLSDGRLIDGDAQHFRPAFVETSFGAQGQTVQRVILGMAAASLPATNQEQLYVSASRAKKSMALYTDDREAVKAAIQRSSQKLAALDVKAKPQPRNVFDLDQERRRRLALTRRRPSAEMPPLPQPERQVSYGRG